MSKKNRKQKVWKPLKEKVPLKNISCASPGDEILPTSQNYKKVKQSHETNQTEDHPLKKSKKGILNCLLVCTLDPKGHDKVIIPLLEAKVYGNNLRLTISPSMHPKQVVQSIPSKYFRDCLEISDDDRRLYGEVKES